VLLAPLCRELCCCVSSKFICLSHLSKFCFVSFAGCRVFEVARAVSRSRFVPSWYFGDHGFVAAADNKHGTDRMSDQLCAGTCFLKNILFSELIVKTNISLMMLKLKMWLLSV